MVPEVIVMLVMTPPKPKPAGKVMPANDTLGLAPDTPRTFPVMLVITASAATKTQRKFPVIVCEPEAVTAPIWPCN